MKLSDVRNDGAAPLSGILALLLAAPCDALTRFSLGGITASSAATSLAAFLLGTLLVANHGKGAASPQRSVPLPLWLFLTWAVASAALFGVSKEGVQNLCVYFIFAVVIALVATSDRQGLSLLIERLITVGWLISAVYAADLIAHGVGSGTWLGRRSFALEALVVMAVLVPRNDRRSGILLYAQFLLVALSLSRTATAAAILLVSAHLAHTRRGRSLVRGLVALSSLILGAVLIVAHVPLVHERLFGGDRGTVFGVTINTEGRDRIWSALHFGSSLPLWLGHGPGAAQARIAAEVSGSAQPHDDYLRILYDYGLVGLILFLGGFLSLLWCAGNAARRAGRAGAVRHTSAALALIAIAMGMATDNVVVYAFAMAPSALVVGLSRADLIRCTPLRRAAEKPTQSHGALALHCKGSLTVSHEVILPVGTHRSPPPQILDVVGDTHPLQRLPTRRHPHQYRPAPMQIHADDSPSRVRFAQRGLLHRGSEQPESPSGLTDSGGPAPSSHQRR